MRIDDWCDLNVIVLRALSTWPAALLFDVNIVEVGRPCNAESGSFEEAIMSAAAAALLTKEEGFQQSTKGSTTKTSPVHRTLRTNISMKKGREQMSISFALLRRL